jgi:cellulose biosynthesis protein BcsQ
MTTPETFIRIPEADGRTTRIIVGVNESGGSVKTTSVSALAAAAAQAGKRVLAIDTDSQRDLSHILGYDDPDGDENLLTLWDVVVEELGTLDEAVIPALQGEGGSPIPNLWLVPASKKLKELDDRLAGAMLRELWLRRLMPALQGRFDIIFIDCPGDLKLITKGALIAGTETMACVKSQEKEARALTELEDTLTEINKSFKDVGIQVELTWVVIGESVKDKSQGKVYTDAETQLREAYGSLVLKPSVRRSTKIPEAYSAQMPLPLWAPRSGATLEYVAIADSMGLTK